MHVNKLLFFFVFILAAQFAWASADFICTPTWSLNRSQYDRCSNLPILSPGNDTRVNLKLLLVDNGFAAFEPGPAAGESNEYGYGKVPFTLATFDRSFFISKGRDEGSKDGERTSGSGGGTRCVSNDAGKTDFIEALELSRDLSHAERKLLKEERQKLNPTCIDATAPKTAARVDSPKPAAKHSKTFNEFMQYLTAAAAFYEGRYDVANSGFTGLVDSRQTWLRETSRYMLARTELNLSQKNAFDEYGFPTPGKADQKALQAAEEKIVLYLRDYPDGRYSSSARGLLRRIYWLSNQQQKLADEYEWQLNHPDSPQHNLPVDALVREAEQKLLATADPRLIRNPLLLATLDLSLMRPAGSAEAKQIAFADLQKQQPLFSDHRELYDYLLAAHRFYMQKDAAGVVKTLPDTIPSKMTYLDFSRLTLRGLALETTKKQLGARRLWLDLLPASGQPLQAETLQLALALNYEQSNELESVFKTDSPITDVEIRSILLRNDASPELLRQVIKSKKYSGRERQTAIYTLLYKDLLQGHYRNYIQDYRFLPKDAAKRKPSPDMNDGDGPNLALFTWSGKKAEDGYGCPSTLEIAGILAKDAEDSYGLVCLGDFVNANDLDSDNDHGKPQEQRSDPGKAVLGTAKSGFPGEAFSRGEAYKAVIEDENATPDLKAYALYRAIKCYATSGTNHCGGEAVDKPARKSWFQTLKSRYADSVWARKLKYYW